MTLHDIQKAQTQFFQSGATRTYAFRKAQLLKLKKAVRAHEEEVIEALKADFDKPVWETWTSEVGVVYAEIDHVIKHLQKWMRPKRVGSPLAMFPTTSKVYSEPMGRCLIIAPWNYPLQLALVPLLAAMAAGNTSLLKPSEITSATAQVIEKIITSTFSEEYIAVVQGKGEEVVPQAIEEFEPQHIFFTGSTAVGRIIGTQAAKKLIPCVLELGGKSPAIIDASANLKVAAQRLVFGKCFNGGQSCVAPDYLIVHHSVLNDFLEKYKAEVHRFYGSEPLYSEHLASMIHDNAFKRVAGYIQDGEVVLGGKTDAEKRRIEPTVILNPPMDSPSMKEEIFGPVLPIITYDKEEEVLGIVRQNPDPLSLYVFSKSKQFQRRIIRDLSFGGGAMNNALIHFVNTDLPFGGIRESGHGNYHGEYGFKAFSHEKGIATSGTWIDPKIKYPPYTNWSLKVAKRLFGL